MCDVVFVFVLFLFLVLVLVLVDAVMELGENFTADRVRRNGCGVPFSFRGCVVRKAGRRSSRAFRYVLTDSTRRESMFRRNPRFFLVRLLSGERRTEWIGRFKRLKSLYNGRDTEGNNEIETLKKNSSTSFFFLSARYIKIWSVGASPNLHRRGDGKERRRGIFL